MLAIKNFKNQLRIIFMDRIKLKEKIESVFNDIGIKYEIIDLHDDDLNFSINVDGSRILNGIGLLDVLIFFKTDIPRCTLLCSNIRKFSNNEVQRAKEIASSINSKLHIGKVEILEDPMQLVYVNSKKLLDFAEIEKSIIEEMISSLQIAIILIYSEIKRYTNEK